MKNTLLIFALLIGAFTYGQNLPINSITFKGITTSKGSTLNTTDRYPVFYDTTLGEFVKWNGTAYEPWEINDLSANVTWANVPDANITESSVTQHESALSVTESQISDFGTYLTSLDGITSSNIIDDAITTSKIADGTIISADIASNTIAGSNVLDESITGSDILNGSIGSIDISDNSIDEINLDTSVNASLALADNSIQKNQTNIVSSSTTIGDSNSTTGIFIVPSTEQAGMLGGATGLVVSPNSIAISGLSDAQIDINGPTSAITKGYADANYGGGGTDDQTASEVPFTPNGSISATDVQAAIQEVRDEAGSGTADGLGPDGDKGDITVGGSGTTLDINAFSVGNGDLAPNSVTDDKISPSGGTALQVLRVNAGGTATEWANADTPETLDYASLELVTGMSNGDLIRVTADGIAGLFKYDSSLSATDDGGVVKDGWVRQFDGDVWANWFGAVGDWNGTTGTDNTSAIQAALDYSKDKKNVKIKAGNFMISSTLLIPTGMTLEGHAMGIGEFEGRGTTLHPNAAFMTTGGFMIQGEKFETGQDPHMHVVGIRNLQLRPATKTTGLHGINYSNAGDGSFIENVKFVNLDKCIYHGRDTIDTRNQLVASYIRNMAFYNSNVAFEFNDVGGICTINTVLSDNVIQPFLITDTSNSLNLTVVGYHLEETTNITNVVTIDDAAGRITFDGVDIDDSANSVTFIKLEATQPAEKIKINATGIKAGSGTTLISDLADTYTLTVADLGNNADAFNFSYNMINVEAGNNDNLITGTLEVDGVITANNTVNINNKLGIATPRTSTWQRALEMYSPLTNGDYLQWRYGKSATAKNAAEIAYYHSGDGSDSNSFNIGFYAGGMPIRAYADGDVLIGKDLSVTGVATSTEFTAGTHNLTEKIGSDITGRTNAVQIVNKYSQPYDDFVADGDPGAGVEVTVTGAPPMEVETVSSSITLDNFKGADDQIADTASFTVDGAKTGGVYQVIIDRATAPTITGSTIMPDTQPFVAATRMSLTFVVNADGSVSHKYAKL